MTNTNPAAAAIGIHISEESGGYSVRFPKMLLDGFKETFRSARWDRHGTCWHVGKRSKKRLDHWASTVAEAAATLAALEEAELTVAETQRLRELAQEALDEVQGRLAALAETRAAIAENRSEIAVAKTAKEAADAERSLAIRGIDETIGSLCGLQTVLNAAEEMARAQRAGPKARNRDRWDHACAEILGEVRKLRAAGWHWAYAEGLLTLNWNRPDRDKPGLVRGRYELTRIEDDAE